MLLVTTGANGAAMLNTPTVHGFEISEKNNQIQMLNFEAKIMK